MEREKMVNEAILRMKKLGLYDEVVSNFQGGVLYYSEPTPLGGILYWVKNNQEWVDIVKNVEEEHKILVYHITTEHTPFGEFLTMLYVSQYDEEWSMDQEDLDNPEDGVFYPYAYVYNLSDPMLSEFGRVGVKEAAGGLIRIH